MAQMPLLIHYHMYKNGGTSLDHLLKSNLGDAWAEFEGDLALHTVSATEMRDFIDANPQLRAISSHRARPPLPCPEAYPIVMLRHPVDRARSIYYFARRDWTQLDHEVAKNNNFRDYIEHFLDRKDAGTSLRNYQVIHLSESSFRHEDFNLATATDADLQQAKDLLQEWNTFGLVRRFSDSCALFNARYPEATFGCSFQDAQENVSTNPTLADDQAVAVARAELGRPTFERLLEANRYDVELYQFARKRFEELVAETLQQA